MGKLRAGVIGYGKIARTHARMLSLDPDCVFVAAYGRDPGKADAFARDFGGSGYAGVAEMVEREKLDLVLVATPHPLHAEHAVAALDAGAHVLVEKPLALTVAECDAMIAAAEKAGRTLGAFSQRRWYPSVRRVKDAIDAGKLGTPVLGEAVMLGWRDEAYYRSDPWRGSWKGEGGGVLVNQAPHPLDILLWFMGRAVEVKAYWANLNHPYIEVEDTAVASVRFTSGALASITVSNSQKPGLYARVHAHGSNGASAGVQTDGGAMFVAGMTGVLEAPYVDLWTVPGEEGEMARWKAEDAAWFASIDPTEHFHALQIRDFAEAVRSGREPAVTAREGRAVVELVEAIYKSGRTGEAVKLPI